MKTSFKTAAIAAAFLCILLLVSCANEAPVEAPPPPAEVDSPFEPVLSSYDSIEEFIEAAQNPDESNSLSDLADLEEFPIPSSLPDNYKAYRVQADRDHVEMWYLPEDCLTHKHLISEAEQRMQHFYFAYYRECSLDELIKKSGNPHVTPVDDKYCIVGKNGCGIYWDEDGKPLMLYVPGNMEFSDGNIISRFNGEITIVASIEEICRTEKITITR